MFRRSHLFMFSLGQVPASSTSRPSRGEGRRSFNLSSCIPVQSRPIFKFPTRDQLEAQHVHAFEIQTRQSPNLSSFPSSHSRPAFDVFNDSSSEFRARDTHPGFQCVGIWGMRFGGSSFAGRKEWNFCERRFRALGLRALCRFRI